MSVFSDLLQNYIHEKKVKVMALAKYCELERSTIYKFINGKREPMSAELVEQIAHFIKLTPQETYQFKEAWKMARMGENDYYIRKSIEHFLSDFPNRSSSSLHNITPPPHTRKFDYFSFRHTKLSSIKFQTGTGFRCTPHFNGRSIQA